MGISRLTLVMMAGLPGAGKTTLAKALGRDLGWPMIDKDSYRVGFIEQGMNFELASDQAYECSFAEIYRILTQERQSVIFDTAALHRSIVDSVVDIADGVPGLHLKVILCVIGREERDRRLRKRGEQHTRITVEPATILDYLRHFEHLPPPPATLTLYTHISPESCLLQAKAHVTS